MKKKYLIILLVVVLLIIIVILPRPRVSKNQPAPVTSSDKNAVATDTKGGILPFAPVTAVPPSQIPKALPANLPFEQGAQILQNFEVKDPSTGKTQSTRVYVSKKTLSGSFAIYQNYLKDNGWTITSSIDQAAVKNLAATKDSARLDITIAADPSGKNTVNVSYVN
jgi:hypothetical protein